MGSLGMYLMIFGGGSALLAIFNYEFTLLSWIDNWGDSVAWFIRAGIVAAGGMMFSAGQRRVAAAEAEHTQSPVS